MPKLSEGSIITAPTATARFAAVDPVKAVNANYTVPFTDVFGPNGFGPQYPALLRSTVSMSLWPGVETGAGKAQAVRLANLIALQAAVDYAEAGGYFLEIEGEFEIEGAAGLLVGTTAAVVWRGAPGTILRQYSANAPVMTIGPASGTAIRGSDISGVDLEHGVAQTGVGGDALRLGIVERTTIAHITANGLVNSPWNSLLGVGGGFFSNAVRDCVFARGQNSCITLPNLWTGNVFSNIHVWMDETLRTAPADAAIVLSDEVSLGSFYGNVFESLIIEHGSGRILYVENANGLGFDGVTVRNWAHDGTDMIEIVASKMRMSGVNFFNCRFKTADGAADDATIFYHFGSSVVDVSGIVIHNDTPSDVDVDWSLFRANATTIEGDPPIFTVSDFAEDISTVPPPGHLDSLLPRADYGMPGYFKSYEWGDPIQRVSRPMFNLDAADFTLHGVFEDALVQLPAVLTAHRSVTLSNRIGPAATRGAAVPVRTGMMATVRRGAGTADGFNLLVKNHDAATLSTISTSATSARFWFNGTDWVLVA